MRDRRFIVEHRGGLLPRDSHACLAVWAADCAEVVIGFFAAHRDDPRPREALATARRWANGEVKTGVAMKASVAAHAAAREATEPKAIAAARAAAHAVATAHASDHSMGALLYVMKALEAAGMDAGAEFKRQIQRLPEHLREQVASGVSARAGRLSIPEAPMAEGRETGTGG
ncbi:MAG: hypothetical protein MUF31_19065 [Akkermansiaceae bacterium]|nr:hypothetical protein [Akkermansiaceae bacterium]